MPTLCIGLRGLIYMEVEVAGPGARSAFRLVWRRGARTQSSGLIELLAKVKNANGVIQIPGIYDDVEPPAPAEKRKLEAGCRSAKKSSCEKEVRFDRTDRRARPSVLERVWARPTFEVHGIAGGFTAAGAKTVIPAKATAKVSFRLVPAAGSRQGGGCFSRVRREEHAQGHSVRRARAERRARAAR